MSYKIMVLWWNGGGKVESWLLCPGLLLLVLEPQSLAMFNSKLFLDTEDLHHSFDFKKCDFCLKRDPNISLKAQFLAHLNIHYSSWVPVSYSLWPSQIFKFFSFLGLDHCTEIFDTLMDAPTRSVILRVWGDFTSQRTAVDITCGVLVVFSGQGLKMLLKCLTVSIMS